MCCLKFNLLYLFWLTRKFYNCYHAKVGTKCYASGWGGTLPVPLDEDTSTFPDKLQAVKLRTISDAQCRNMCEKSNINWPRAFLKDFEVCVGGGGKGACHISNKPLAKFPTRELRQCIQMPSFWQKIQ